MRRREALAALTVLALFAGTASASEAPADVRSGALEFDRTIALPPPDTSGTMPLEEAIGARRSARDFSPDPLPLAMVGQLLWAAQGVTGDEGKRAAPSAGALYPLELYVLTDDVELHYLPEGHRVEERPARSWRSALVGAALGQETAGSAPAVVVVAGVVERTRAKYGARAETFVALEAGHATQNLLLEAAALGLAAVPIGGIDPDAVADALALPPGSTALYLVPVGFPASAS